jgi:hypothetical protein
MTCGRSPHGAVAVLCRACLDAYQSGRAVLRYICNGVPWLDGRSPFIALKGTWRHDLAMHAGQDGGF